MTENPDTRKRKTLTKRLYIASTLTNADRVRRLRDKFATFGVRLTYDWTLHNDGIDLHIPDSNPPRKQEVALNEYNGVLKADVVLVIMPGGCGTHFEFGAAYATGTPIVLLLDEHSGPSPCFHFLPLVTRCFTEAEAVTKVMTLLGDTNAECDNHEDRARRRGRV